MSASTSTSPTHPPGVPAWRIFLRLLGPFIALATFARWAASGYNRGWTKNRVETVKVDEITGIEYIEWVDAFIPGIELLSLGVAAGLLLFAVTFVPRRKTNPT
ncbi:MAG: hypothetical protein KIT44_01850 [Opitutaceae bacterium]|nr:hypothetical protein [Opitutaceae bacterium]